MAELADALDLGSSGATRAGSIPVSRTFNRRLSLREQARPAVVLFKRSTLPMRRPGDDVDIAPALLLRSPDALEAQLKSGEVLPEAIRVVWIALLKSADREQSSARLGE